MGQVNSTDGPQPALHLESLLDLHRSWSLYLFDSEWICWWMKSVIDCYIILKNKSVCGLRKDKQSFFLYFLILYLSNGVWRCLQNVQLAVFLGALHFPGLPEGKERVHGAPECTGQQYCMYPVTEKAFCGNLESQRDRCGKTCALGVLLGILLSVAKVVPNMLFLVSLLTNEEENRN